MDSNCRKLGETPYRECRKQAAIYNDALGSMERAAEMLGVSVNTLSNYELGVTVPPVDIIIVMADLYRAPQLKTMYCNRYVLRYINEGGQRSVFDPDYEQNLKGNETEPDESTMLPGPSNELPDNEGVIDADYKEVDEAEEGENQPDTATGEEITSEEDGEAPGGNPEFTDSVEDDDYEYDDPEEEE